MGSVLVVDDERSMREFLAIFLKRAGHEVTMAASGMEGLEQGVAAPPDVLITDLKMPETIAAWSSWPRSRRATSTPRSSWSRPTPPPTPRSAMRQGAYDYLTKP